MRPWPQAHKNLTAIVILALVAALVCYFMLVRPKAQDVRDMENGLTELQKKLKNTGWPLNAENLQALLDENTRKLKGTKREDKGYEGLETKAVRIVDGAARTFQKHIEDNYGTVKTFIDQAGWLDYQSDFSDLEEWLRGNGVIISEKTFGISIDTSNTETYQLLLHIWTVRELVQLAIEHDLVLGKDRANAIPTPEGRAILPSRIRVLPVQAYVLNNDDRVPYLLELPVRMTMRGTLQDFMAFVADLQSAGRFLPISRMELSTENPAFRGTRPTNDGYLKVTNIEVTVVCSSFFCPRDSAPEVRIKKSERAPKGA